MSLIATYSIQKLVHFKCTAPGCGKWWAMENAPVNRHYFCPWCGQLHFGCRESAVQAGTESGLLELDREGTNGQAQE